MRDATATFRRWGLTLALCWAVAGCIPPPPPLAPGSTSDAQPPGFAVAAPTFVWSESERPRAVIVALHGLKGSAGVFAAPAARWTRQSITTYACTLDFPNVRPAEVNTLIRQVAAHHPGVPLIVLGESLGASLTIMALSRPDAPHVDALVLSAPAIWPDAVSASAIRYGLGWLRLLADSRRVQYWGEIVSLMDAARERAPSLRIKTVLVLTGGQDEVVPHRGVEVLVERLGNSVELRSFPNSGHTLFRNAGGDDVADQVGNWLLQRASPSAATKIDSESTVPAGGTQANAN